MQLSSIFDNENDLIAQNQDIGIPTAEELQNSPNTKWTGPYVEENGMDDGGYWESIMDEFDETEYPQSESIAPTDKPQIILDEGTSYAYTPPILEAQIEQNHTLPAPQKQDTVNTEEPYMLEGGIEYKNTVPTSYIEKLANKYEGLTPRVAKQKAAAKIPVWKSSEKEYYKHALKRADREEPNDFMKEQNDFKKIHEIHDPDLRQMFINKAARMYELDANDPTTYDAVKDVEVVIPKLGSQLNSQIKKSDTFQKWVVENYDDIKNNNKQNASLTFPAAIFNNAKRALFGTLHNVDVKNSKINEDGSYSAGMLDGYDYAHWNNRSYKDSKTMFDPIKIFVNNKIINVNNRAKKQQDTGQLERYLLSTQINLTKEEVLKYFPRIF